MSGPYVALLTGGSDKPYALGLAAALDARGVTTDFIGSKELDCPEVHALLHVRFLDLRGDQSPDAPLAEKLRRIVAYYARLIHYVAAARVRILHILWNSKFEFFDRTLLMAYYRTLGKRVVLTAHNVNAAARNGSDSWLNRLTLRVQYALCHHIFVHTEAMKRQLISGFHVPEARISVIPFGINDTIPKTTLTPAAARASLGLGADERTLLFFGQIASYKGLEYLIDAVVKLAYSGERVRLVIAGKVKRGSEAYWNRLQRTIAESGVGHLVIQKIGFVPDAEVEPYFKAADCVVIPYLDIFQSGVPFLAFSFGVPVIATDVGSLREDVTPETGLLCRPRDSNDLARAIKTFYRSELYTNTANTRPRIRCMAEQTHSWNTVGERTEAVYAALLSDGSRVTLVPAAAAATHDRPRTKCQE